MNAEQARKTLIKSQSWDVLHQQDEKELLTEAFRTFWESCPKEKEFGEVMKNNVLFAEYMYIMSCKSNFP